MEMSNWQKAISLTISKSSRYLSVVYLTFSGIVDARAAGTGGRDGFHVDGTGFDFAGRTLGHALVRAHIAVCGIFDH